MRRNTEIIRLVMVIVTLYYGVCQNGVKGNTLKNGKAEDDNNNKEIISVEDSVNKNETVSHILKINESLCQSKIEASEKILEENGNKVKSTDDTENLNDGMDLDSDATTTLCERLQEMPLKLGLQLLTAKYGLSESLDKARRGGAHIYEGAKDAVKTMADFISEGFGNARFLLFGSK